MRISLLLLGLVAMHYEGRCQAVDRRPGVILPTPGKYVATAVESDFELPEGVVLPRSLDLSKYFPAAGDQGQQASCTAWAMGYGLATFRNNWERDHRPDPSLPPDLEHVFSPGFLFNMVKWYEQPDTSAMACLYGVNTASTFTIACEWGNCPWAVYPYDIRTTGCKDTVGTASIEEARGHKLPTPVAMWKRRRSGDGAMHIPFDPIQWKYHMARKEPVVMSFSIDCSFAAGGDSIARVGGPYIWDHPIVLDDSCSGGHVMVCAGYDDRDSTFTFLNSYGSHWGQRGYVKITYRTLLANCMEAYVFSHAWWRNIPVKTGKATRKAPTVDSTLHGRIKVGDVYRFHDLEVRVSILSPHGRNMVVQFSDTARTRPVTVMEFPQGVERSFVYEDKLWSFEYSAAKGLHRLSKAVPFEVEVDADGDEELEQGIDAHFQKFRAIVKP